MGMIELGKTPIEGESPAGADASYDPEFEELQAEIDKMASPSASESVDWGKVVAKATNILSSKSKDLRAAIYLAVALTQTQKAEGTLTGVRICKDLIENYWESLYPPKKRLRGRINVLDWWMERINAFLQQGLVMDSHPADLPQNLKQEIDLLDQVMQDKVPDGPSLRPLRDLLNQIPAPREETSEDREPSDRAEEGAETETVPKAAVVKPSAAQAQTASQPEADVAAQDLYSTQEVQRALNELFTQARSLASRLNDIEPANALGYRLRRFTLWGGVESTPPSIEGKTRIPPPPDQVRRTLNDLQDKGTWDNVIKTAESRLSQHIFWLDLNRLSARGLQELGPAYRAAAEAIARETAFLLLRVPQLEQLAFSDGTPFASPETLDWLQDNRLDGESQGSSGPSHPGAMGDETASKLPGLTAQAFDLLREGQLQDGLQVLQEALDRGGSQRERFQFRITLCRYLLAAKKAKHVQPHVEVLFKTIDSHRLEEWEPDLAAEALKTIYTGLRTQKGDDARAASLEAFERLARVDPSTALSLDKS
jgi:type VI secretion system protein VasJ